MSENGHSPHTPGSPQSGQAQPMLQTPKPEQAQTELAQQSGQVEQSQQQQEQQSGQVLQSQQQVQQQSGQVLQSQQQERQSAGGTGFMADTVHEGRDDYFMDIDRMVNEGLGGGQVTIHNGLIDESTTDTMDNE